MQQLDKMLNEMDNLLDQLIENAKKLLDLSTHLVVEEALIPLQSQQEELLDQLMEKDEEITQGDFDESSLLHVTKRKKVNEKIDIFQKLNENFIENVTKNHSSLSDEDEE